MSEQQDALEDLEASGVLAAVAWANASAYRRTMEDYDPDTGHDQGWVGSTAHRLFVDRLHRAFSTGKHGVDSPESASAGLDLVAAGLAPGEHRKMPLIAPGVVVWSDLNQSPGWRCGDWRFLLTSFVYGEVNRIPWPQKSPTKQRVASQGKPAGWLDPHPTLFDDDESDSLAVAIQAQREEDAELNATTLIVAHSIERELSIRELYVGRSRLNHRGGEAWFWKHDLLASNPGAPTAEPIPTSPDPRPGSSVQDAPVRLRRQSSEGSGERHRALGENDK